MLAISYVDDTKPLTGCGGDDGMWCREREKGAETERERHREMVTERQREAQKQIVIERQSQKER